MNRDAETIPARHETPDVAELRQLLAGASPLPWQWEPPSGDTWPQGDESLVTTSGAPVLYGWGYDASGIDATAGDRALIAAAVNALPGLLDAADALRAELAHMREAAALARAEVERLTGRVELVREWIDHRGVDVSDRDGAYMDGYRAAQRHALQDAAKLRRALDEEPQP